MKSNKDKWIIAVLGTTAYFFGYIGLTEWLGLHEFWGIPAFFLYGGLTYLWAKWAWGEL